MSDSSALVSAALERGMRLRPKVGGFPHLAAALHEAGVLRNEWHPPGMEAVYLLADDTVVAQGQPLEIGLQTVAPFNETALISVIRADQAGEGTFDDFVRGAWAAGVIRYVVDLEARTCVYSGAKGETYLEHYPQMTIDEQ